MIPTDVPIDGGVSFTTQQPGETGLSRMDELPALDAQWRQRVAFVKLFNSAMRVAVKPRFAS